MKQFHNGLSAEVVRMISAAKDEPKWMLELRLEAYRIFVETPMPEIGPDLSEVDFDAICYFSGKEEVADRWDKVPKEMRRTYEELGLPAAEQRYLAGLGAQYDSEMIYRQLKDEWDRQGVIFVDTDTAVREYPELVREYFGSVVRAVDNKFAALNMAVWSGGSFVYVPRGVKLEAPLQTYFRINISNIGQFEHTVIVVDEDAELHYIEACTAPIYREDALHAGVVEVLARPRSRVRTTTIQNWSKSVISLATQKMRVEAGAVGEIVSGNIGSRITRKKPTIILSGEGACGDILSLSMAGAGQVQDSGAGVIHLASQTSSTIVSRSISRDGGVSTYRGLVEVGLEADGVKSSSKCDALLLDAESVSNTYPDSILARSDASLAHEASVSRVDEAQLFYLMSRGIPEEEARGMIVNGFIEPIVRELPMEYASELNQLIRMSMKGSIG